ncbi:MAG: HXXEE domain-containing protein [bacterium]|jgi:hypothetical protein
MEYAGTSGEEARWRRYVWLFPATYFVHIVEEIHAGEAFPAWISGLSGVEVTKSAFLTTNAVVLAGMLLLSGLVALRASLSWLVAVLGATVVLNGLLHVTVSIFTGSYSPGAVSGLLLWLPLGGLAMWRARSWLAPRVWLAAVLGGVALHVMVVAFGLLITRNL